MEEDIRWMRLCLERAQEARDRGEAPVGAVLVHDGILIAAASEQVLGSNDPTAHAELVAIRQACAQRGMPFLTNAILYTNVEPCWMCSYVIREARIGRIVIGIPVDDIGGLTSRYPLLSDATVPDWSAPPTIVWGVLANEAAALAQQRTNHPLR